MVNISLYWALTVQVTMWLLFPTAEIIIEKDKQVLKWCSG